MNRQIKPKSIRFWSSSCNAILKRPLRSLAYDARLEHEPLKLGVVGSNPTRLTKTEKIDLEGLIFLVLCGLGCDEKLRWVRPMPGFRRKRRRIVHIPPDPPNERIIELAERRCFYLAESK